VAYSIPYQKLDKARVTGSKDQEALDCQTIQRRNHSRLQVTARRRYAVGESPNWLTRGKDRRRVLRDAKDINLGEIRGHQNGGTGKKGAQLPGGALRRESSEDKKKKSNTTAP